LIKKQTFFRLGFFPGPLLETRHAEAQAGIQTIADHSARCLVGAVKPLQARLQSKVNHCDAPTRPSPSRNWFVALAVTVSFFQWPSAVTMPQSLWAASIPNPIRDFTKARFLRSAFSTTVIPFCRQKASEGRPPRRRSRMVKLHRPLGTDLHWECSCGALKPESVPDSQCSSVRSVTQSVQPSAPVFVTLLKAGSTPGCLPLMLSPLGLVGLECLFPSPTRG